MTAKTLNVVLREAAAGSWTSTALTLPAASVLSISDDRGASVAFQLRDGALVLEGSKEPPLFAIIELAEELVAASALETAKLDLEQEKMRNGERLARRTLIVTVATALISAGATIAVAAITNLSGKSEKPQPSAYKDLNECREGLGNLKTLSSLDRQTPSDLGTAVANQVDDCKRRLQKAMDASQP